MSYSYSKNNDKYGPNRISQEFGQPVADELKQLPGKPMQQDSAQVRQIVKLTRMSFTAFILLIVVLGIVLINIPG